MRELKIAWTVVLIGAALLYVRAWRNDGYRKADIQAIDERLTTQEATAEKLAQGWMDNRAALSILAAEQSGLVKIATPYVIMPPEVIRDNAKLGEDVLLKPLESLSRYYPKTWEERFAMPGGIQIEPGKGIQVDVDVPLDERGTLAPEIKIRELTPDEVDKLERDAEPVNPYDQKQLF